MKLRPLCIWITGLPAAGKSTLAEALERELKQRGVAACVIDGDVLRTGLNRDLGFTVGDRAESVRRAGEVALMMVDAGLVTIVSLISPFRKDRDGVRARFAVRGFHRGFSRYASRSLRGARPQGTLSAGTGRHDPEFTGVSSPYEEPLAAELVVPSTGVTPRDLAMTVLGEIAQLLAPHKFR